MSGAAGAILPDLVRNCAVSHTSSPRNYHDPVLKRARQPTTLSQRREAHASAAAALAEGLAGRRDEVTAARERRLLDGLYYRSARLRVLANTWTLLHMDEPLDLCRRRRRLLTRVDSGPITVTRLEVCRATQVARTGCRAVVTNFDVDRPGNQALLEPRNVPVGDDLKIVAAVAEYHIHTSSLGIAVELDHDSCGF